MSDAPGGIPGGASTPIPSQPLIEKAADPSPAKPVEKPIENKPEIKGDLVLRIRVDKPDRDEILKLPANSTLIVLKMKLAELIGVIEQDDLRRYTYQVAPLGEDLKTLIGDSKPLSDLGVESYSTLFVVAPDDVRARYTKPKTPPVKKVKLSAKGKRLKEMVPGADNALIMDTLADCQDNADRAMEKLLKMSLDVGFGGGFQVPQDKPVSEKLIKQVATVTHFSDAVCEAALKKSGSNVERAIEWLFKQSRPSDSKVRSLKFLFSDSSDQDVRDALIVSEGNEDRATDWLLKKREADAKKPKLEKKDPEKDRKDQNDPREVEKRKAEEAEKRKKAKPIADQATEICGIPDVDEDALFALVARMNYNVDRVINELFTNPLPNKKKEPEKPKEAPKSEAPKQSDNSNSNNNSSVKPSDEKKSAPPVSVSTGSTSASTSSTSTSATTSTSTTGTTSTSTTETSSTSGTSSSVSVGTTTSNSPPGGMSTPVTVPSDEKKSSPPPRGSVSSSTEQASSTQTAPTTTTTTDGEKKGGSGQQAPQQTPTETKSTPPSDGKLEPVVSLGDGAVLYRGVLTLDEQQGIVKACNQLDTSRDDAVGRMLKLGHFRNLKEPMQLLSINWTTEGKKINIGDSGGLFDFGAATYKRARDVSGELTGKNTEESCAVLSPTALQALWYCDGAALPLHVDPKGGWVLSISVGCAADFEYVGSKSSEPRKIRLFSGDVIVYNGAKWRHGVANLVPSTAPSFWPQLAKELGVVDLARFVLQFRDSSHVPK